MVVVHSYFQFSNDATFVTSVMVTVFGTKAIARLLVGRNIVSSGK